jgi:hypothetical protein
LLAKGDLCAVFEYLRCGLVLSRQSCCVEVENCLVGVCVECGGDVEELYAALVVPHLGIEIQHTALAREGVHDGLQAR